MNKQLIVLFLCSLCMCAIGNGLLPLLPVYALSLGATPTVVGWVMACAYVALALGTVSASWLASLARSYRRTFVAVGLLSAPALFALGLTSDVWRFAMLLAAAWFCGGVAGVLVNVFTGLHADPAHRGRIFGLMYLALPLGALVGALSVGALVQQFGYEVMFGAAGALAVGWPLLGAWGLGGDDVANAPGPAASVVQGRLLVPLCLLLLATLLSAITTIVGRLGLSLAMEARAFGAGAISSTTAIGGVIALPTLPLIGALSDRMGRRGFLTATYLLGAASVVVLALSDQLWHFWLAAALLAIAVYTGTSVASAFTTDLLPQQALGRGLALQSGMNWAAACVGFAGSGYVLELFGATALYLSAAALSLLAAALLLLIPSRTQQQS